VQATYIQHCFRLDCIYLHMSSKPRRNACAVVSKHVAIASVWSALQNCCIFIRLCHNGGSTAYHGTGHCRLQPLLGGSRVWVAAGLGTVRALWRCRPLSLTDVGVALGCNQLVSCSGGSHVSLSPERRRMSGMRGKPCSFRSIVDLCAKSTASVRNVCVFAFVAGGVIQ